MSPFLSPQVNFQDNITKIKKNPEGQLGKGLSIYHNLGIKYKVCSYFQDSFWDDNLYMMYKIFLIGDNSGVQSSSRNESFLLRYPKLFSHLNLANNEESAVKEKKIINLQK